MTTADDIKCSLIAALVEVLDEPLKAVGFSRNRKSLVYSRTVNETEHKIIFTAHLKPKYQPGAEAHIYPSVQVSMPKVSEVALSLVGGDKLLLANSPDLIIGQPIDFTAPKDKHERWFATGKDQFVAACSSIHVFLTCWVLPFLSEIAGPGDLIKLYETNDPRITKQKHWYIFIVAAYQLTGQSKMAREVVQQQFGSPGLRNRYASMFVSLAIN